MIYYNKGDKMRLWSLHPSYLDDKGLVALWRESLLALKVLKGETKGYKNHPQLERFKETINPITFIRYYLESIWIEAHERGYKFNRELISPKVLAIFVPECFEVTKGQLEYEFNHLYKKLLNRNREKAETIWYWTHPVGLHGRLDNNSIRPNPLFKVIEGKIADWEKIK
jgi:hypothetical protein